jgi:hypothetical protein
VIAASIVVPTPVPTSPTLAASLVLWRRGGVERDRSGYPALVARQTSRVQRAKPGP